ncbi:hypothetical protein TNCV_3475991 [Trichonephila clavipes]|nr:hypothetical protein TNCV_3475991 [Trichonephila clavipes]
MTGANGSGTSQAPALAKVHEGLFVYSRVLVILDGKRPRQDRPLGQDIVIGDEVPQHQWSKTKKEKIVRQLRENPSRSKTGKVKTEGLGAVEIGDVKQLEVPRALKVPERLLKVPEESLEVPERLKTDLNVVGDRDDMRRPATISNIRRFGIYSNKMFTLKEKAAHPFLWWWWD